MIQRIQTLYLLLAVVCAVATLFLPAFTATMDAAPESLTAFYPRAHALTLGVAAIAPTCWLISIFLFSNRRNQMRVVRIGNVAALLYFILLGAIWYMPSMLCEACQSLRPATAVGLNFVALLCGFLARRAIKKDDDLVRAADRIR